MEKKFQERYMLARLRASDAKIGWPFFRRALFVLSPVITEQVPTLASDRHWRIYINPDFLLNEELDKISAGVVHELYHIILKHFERTEILTGKTAGKIISWQKMLCNVCQDMAINDINNLISRLPNNSISAAFFNCRYNLMWEEYYKQLIQRVELKNNIHVVTGCGINFDQDFPLENPESNSGSLDSDKNSNNGKNYGGCGSCSHGVKQDYELTQPDKEAGIPGIKSNSIQEEAVLAGIAKDVDDFLATHFRGNISSELLIWVQNKLKPKVNYKNRLKSFLKKAIYSASSGTGQLFSKKINRRQHLSPDLIRPGSVAGKINVVSIVDTSASMLCKMQNNNNCNKLEQCIAEVESLFHSLKNRINLVNVYFDCKLKDRKRINKISDIKDIKGGGGTDMSLALNSVYNRDKGLRKPNLVLLFTDGETDWPKIKPTYNLVIVIFNSVQAKSQLIYPSWKDQVEIIYIEV